MAYWNANIYFNTKKKSLENEKCSEIAKNADKVLIHLGLKKFESDWYYFVKLDQFLYLYIHLHVLPCLTMPSLALPDLTFNELNGEIILNRKIFLWTLKKSNAICEFSKISIFPKAPKNNHFPFSSHSLRKFPFWLESVSANIQTNIDFYHFSFHFHHQCSFLLQNSFTNVQNYHIFTNIFFFVCISNVKLLLSVNGIKRCLGTPVLRCYRVYAAVKKAKVNHNIRSTNVDLTLASNHPCSFQMSIPRYQSTNIACERSVNKIPKLYVVGLLTYIYLFEFA